MNDSNLTPEEAAKEFHKISICMGKETPFKVEEIISSICEAIHKLDPDISIGITEQATHPKQEQGMKWVKWQDRLPVKKGWYFIRYLIGNDEQKNTDYFNGLSFGTDSLSEYSFEWLDESTHPEPVNTWTTVKPEFNKECLLICACYLPGGWEYITWWIKKLISDDVWYWGLCNTEGEEYGDIADLKADRYLVIDLPSITPSHPEAKEGEQECAACGRNVNHCVCP